MNDDDKTNTEKIDCLVTVGKGGGKSHRGYAEVVTINPGQPWARRKIQKVFACCRMMSGTGRMYYRGVRAHLGTDPNNATCEHCK